MGLQAFRADVGRQVLAESIELQHHVAEEIALVPLPPEPRRRHPLVVDLCALVVALALLTVCGWLIV